MKCHCSTVPKLSNSEMASSYSLLSILTADDRSCASKRSDSTKSSVATEAPSFRLGNGCGGVGVNVVVLPVIGRVTGN